MGTKTYSESYSYSDGTNGDGSLKQMTTGTGDTIDYTYNKLKQLEKTEVKNTSGSPVFNTAYAYRAVSGNQISAQVEFRNVRRSSDNELLEGKKYDYDSVGNIIQISQSTGDYHPLVKYEYDSQNQLISEIYYNGEGSANTNITAAYYYTYDTAGNLQRVEEGAVGTDGTITKTVIQTYSYSNGDWKDLLTKVNNNPIAYEGQTYDANTNTVSGTAISGNPTSYPVNGAIYNLTWENGRQLSSIKNSNAARPLLSRKTYYSYNANGIRTEKKVPRGKTAYTVHSYITQNGKVVRETIAGSTAKVLDFIYDESGRPFALIYTDGTGDPETYYYILNQQGDVVKLIQRKETVVDGETTVSYPEAASYTYDAWGKILDATGSMAAINPLRYRGYYYDTETGFYYLQSRYYDPVNHRFINADGFASTGQGFIGCNMFAYCGNSPVARLDPSGTGWICEIIESVIHAGNDFMVAIGIDTAAFGAFFLQMTPDSKGVYHADFNCWQQYFGYNELYDILFDIGTDMASTSSDFLCSGNSYRLWCWKGDYINLGAGIEAGIYVGSGPHWTVDKSVTLNMSLLLRYNGEYVASYSGNTWWGTAFNPKYQNCTANSLSALYVFNLYNSRDVFYSLFSENSGKPGWRFDTHNYVAMYSN